MSSKEIQREQDYVSMLYERLDALREQASTRLRDVLRMTGGTHQAHSERDAAHARYAAQIAQLNAAENGICFGRLDSTDGSRRYIGRLGLFDEDNDEPLLIDWRAPAARSFYTATAVSPQGVRLRRHIRDRQRKIVEIYDELLDADPVDGEIVASPSKDGITGQAALLAAINASRTGQMGDIVTTIQAEQDKIIRSRHNGVLVVQGSPGTGKTAVALHRAAYLLYSQREQLAKRGVLVIGPNATFLRYIANVLPALGETSALLSTIGELYPGIVADRPESPYAAEVKGRLLMADVVATAVADREWVPDDFLEIEYEGYQLRLDRQTCDRVREMARGTRLPHNQSRPMVVKLISAELARQFAREIGTDPYDHSMLLGESAVQEIQQEMLVDPVIQGVFDELWPSLTPEELLTDLFSSADRIESAAPQLTPHERELLRRDPDGGWAASDVPLLDEAAELLGHDDRAERARAERDRQQRIAYAQGVLDVATGSRSIDLEDNEDSDVLSITDVIDASQLAQRQDEEDYRTVAERAAADRTWAFGHVIVDEAQELSEMAWRLLMRRCPAKSMTIVGDTAQTGELSGTGSWGAALNRYLGDRWRLEELTQNYRLPAEIMDVAAKVLAELDPARRPPRSVRATGFRPWRLRVPPATLPGRLAEIVAREVSTLGDRRLAVIVPRSRAAEIGSAVAAAVPLAAIGADPELSSPVVVLDTWQVKGLEFDSVLIAEPAQILADSPRGLNDLYVALTRATQRLGVVYEGELLAALADLREGEYSLIRGD